MFLIVGVNSCYFHGESILFQRACELSISLYKQHYLCGPFSKAAERQVLSLAFIQKGTNRQTLLSSQSPSHEGFGFTVRNAKYFKVSKPFLFARNIDKENVIFSLIVNFLSARPYMKGTTEFQRVELQRIFDNCQEFQKSHVYLIF